jgi:hypothetical protein
MSFVYLLSSVIYYQMRSGFIFVYAYKILVKCPAWFPEHENLVQVLLLSSSLHIYHFHVY